MTNNKNTKESMKNNNSFTSEDQSNIYSPKEEKILSKKEIRDILGDKADIDYDRNYSHYHCWHQEQPSACGIPLEDHKQCCLCDKEYTPQKKDTSWEERFDEKYFSVYEKYPEYKESHSILLNDIKDFITKEIQKAKEDTIKEVIEKIDKNYLEYCRQYNGRNDCKNCGLNLEDLQTLLKQKI